MRLQFDPHYISEFEAGMGVEPTCEGFADLCLAVWLPSQNYNIVFYFFSSSVNFSILAALSSVSSITKNNFGTGRILKFLFNCC